MKRIFFLLIAANGALSAIAQKPVDTSSHKVWFKPDNMLSRWVLDVNVLGGLLSQNLTIANTAPNYTNAVSTNISNIKFSNGYTFGADAQIGYFFGEKSHWGIGAGFMYLYQQGDMTMDNFRVEYQSYDGSGNTFRQIITADNQVKEHITVMNMNIPLVLKYKKRFTQRVGITADAGILYNIQEKNSYKVDNSVAFDYEAIYQYTTPPLNGLPTLYDNSATPNATDFLITKSHFNNENSQGNVNQYFQQQAALGYNVGLGAKPAKNSGDVSYLQGSVGFIFRPGINLYLSDRTALMFGLYYIYQPFNNSVPTGYRLTDKVGSYNSMLNSISSSANQTYGLNIGLRFYLGNKRAPATINFIDQTSPSACGVCDGSMTLYGLPKGKNVDVTYNMNSAVQPAFTGVVSSDGTVKVQNLCAGYYTDITAKVGRRSATGTSVVLAEPIINVSANTFTNPTAPGATDGTITIRGSFPKTAIVNYSYNGATQSSTGHANAADNTITITGLADGTYTDIVVTSNNCTAKVSDITLTAPKPLPPPVKRNPEIDLNTPILFETGKAIIHESSYDVLEEAVLELNDNPDAVIIIDGHTDDVGTPSMNRVLSNKRADAVKQYLLEMGVNPKRLLTVGHGDELPVSPNSTAEGRAKNRRVIMTLKHRHD